MRLSHLKIVDGSPDWAAARTAIFCARKRKRNPGMSCVEFPDFALAVLDARLVRLASLNPG
jgi:hypothetical protein